MSLANVEIGLLLSVLLAGVILTVAYFAVHSVTDPDTKKRGQLGDILKDKDSEHREFYSLTNFQFTCWTVVFLFSLTWVYFVRISGNVLTSVPSLPTATLALMGINTVSAVASKSIGKGKVTKRNDDVRKSFWGMLYSEDNGPDLTRIQFFIWTVISIIIYIYILGQLMLGPYLLNLPPVSLQSLTIPDVDPSLVTLMGLSQVAYVGTKYVNRKANSSTKQRGVLFDQLS